MNSPWWVPVLFMAAFLPWVCTRRSLTGPPRSSPWPPGLPAGEAVPMRDGRPPDLAEPARTAHRGRPVRGGRLSRWVGRISYRGQGPDRIDVAVLADVPRAANRPGGSRRTGPVATGGAVPGPRARRVSRVAAALRSGRDWAAAWERA